MATSNTLPDSAGVKVFPALPALPVVAAEQLLSAIDKLFIQFQKEGNVVDYTLAVEGEGAFIVVAWTGAGEGLSGCRKDKLAKVIALHEQRNDAALLTPPPIWVADTAGKPQGMTPVAFKAAVAAGNVDAATPCWNTMAEQLGEWRAHAGGAIADLPWLAQKLQRVQDRLQRSA